VKVGDKGLENTPLALSRTSISEAGGAQSGALPVDDPDLTRLITAWPKLPEAIRRGILALTDVGDSAS